MLESPQKKKWPFSQPLNNYSFECWLKARYCVLDGGYRDGREKDGLCLRFDIILLILIVLNSWIEPLVPHPSVQCGVG